MKNKFTIVCLFISCITYAQTGLNNQVADNRGETNTKQLLSVNKYVWQNATWTYSQKENHEYNESGQVLRILRFTIDDDTLLTGKTLYAYYNENNLLKQTTDYAVIFPTTGELTSVFQNEYFYDGLEKPSEEIETLLYPSVQSINHFYQYNTNEYLTVEYIIKPNSTAWDSLEIITYSYQDTLLIDKYTQIKKDSIWQNKSYAHYVYDSNAYKCSMVLQDWDSTHWVNDFETTYTWTNNYSTLEEVYGFWANDAWDDQIRVVSMFDGEGNIQEKVTQNFMDSLWVNNEKVGYEYGVAGLQETIFEKDYFPIFPNPSPGLFTLQFNDGKNSSYSVEIMDMTGKSVYRKHDVKTNSTAIDLRKQPRGIYFVKVIAKGEVFTKKVAIK